MELDRGFLNLEKLMSATALRHRVLTSNIANSDTPYYKAKDVDFSSFFDGERLKMDATKPMHFKDGVPMSASGVTVDDNALLWGDSNNVEVDMEVAKMTENALKYQAAAKLVSQKIMMYKTAMKRNI
ncbi:flagellar basal body rod protein FlgB [Candidatus Magnetominusculus xianensis]|uniref:Flagellar basal body rod protein FlgB n=1 Tax=Candidatus Magnetominusculus xianensis TaxID=1748249 RepID=A0ABR5SG44_9BACT|nr:flagellar basal body rod protein FlgB [Candidatus Magnetominusculus xianensis]KWT85143.1 flagellar biosynthesis protein FlgB [Candidatus Magnetominusculus xianensis]MBF0405401.1 flagellar basal body rod protein FlgB [Nitrospirota bacterium]